MSAALVSYRWELRKLRSLRRTYLGLGAAVAVPLIFAIAVTTQRSSPNDVAFGSYIHQTGLAIPLVLLLFGSAWMYPLIVALVAGDIVASEDHNGTLKTILTRGVDRGPLLAGKAFAGLAEDQAGAHRAVPDRGLHAGLPLLLADRARCGARSDCGE